MNVYYVKILKIRPVWLLINLLIILISLKVAILYLFFLVLLKDHAGLDTKRDAIKIDLNSMMVHTVTQRFKMVQYAVFTPWWRQLIVTSPLNRMNYKINVLGYYPKFDERLINQENHFY